MRHRPISLRYQWICSCIVGIGPIKERISKKYAACLSSRDRPSGCDVNMKACPVCQGCI